MTITSQTTQRGKVIHLVSSSDLVDAVQCGERLRAYCPIHGSDHQRSLSIDCVTGWGFCHSCHATVLVQPNAPVIASSQGNRYGQRSANGGGVWGRACAEHRPVPSVRPYLLRRGRSTTPLPHWQQEEVAALIAVAPMMREALASSRRALLYLSDRALPLLLALATWLGHLLRTNCDLAPVCKEQQVH